MDTTQTTEQVVDTQIETTEQTVETTQETTQENTSTEKAETVVTEPAKPFELPVEQQRNPFEGLTPESVAAHFGSDQQQKQALLKAFGLDDFALGAIDYYQRTGGLAEYAEVKSVDYNKTPDENIVERKLREQYATQGLSEDELKLLIEDEMLNRYKQDTEVYSEREVQLGKIRMKAEAAEHRKTLIDRQAQFKAPEREVVQAAPQVSYEQQIEQTRNTVLQDAGVQQFLAAKKLQMGDPQSPYNFEVPNPQDTLAILYDNNRYSYHVAQKNAQGQVLLNTDGNIKLDYSKMLKVAAYVENMDAIEKNLIAHGRELGKQDIVDEAENVNLNKSNGATKEPEDVFTALNRKLTGQ